jgi:hypothetical protein
MNPLVPAAGLALVLALALTGCAGQPRQSSLEDEFGTAYRSAMAEQVLYPDRVGRGGEPVEGIDGVRAVKAVHAVQAGPGDSDGKGGKGGGQSADSFKSLLGGSNGQGGGK